MSQITVLGVGNILLRDEGFGVKVAEELQQRYRFPDFVQVLDGGTLGMELLRFLTDTKKILIVDAVDGGEKPGTFYRFAGDEVQAYFQEKVSLHDMGIRDVLTSLEILGHGGDETVIMGVQPESLELGLDLTATVAAVLPLTLSKVLEQLSLWGVEVGTHE